MGKDTSNSCYQCYSYIKESVIAFFNLSLHFLSFSHLKVESLWQALGMTVPGLEREKDDILEVLNWLPPSGPREVKALVCRWSSKGYVAKPLSLIC